MKLQPTQSAADAATMGSISGTTVYRVEQDPRLPSQRALECGRRRPICLPAISMPRSLRCSRPPPDIRAVAIVEEMMRRHPDLDEGLQRTPVDFERGACPPLRGTVAATRPALANTGIAFIPKDGKGRGVRLARASAE